MNRVMQIVLTISFICCISTTCFAVELSKPRNMKEVFEEKDEQGDIGMGRAQENGEPGGMHIVSINMKQPIAIGEVILSDTIASGNSKERQINQAR